MKPLVAAIARGAGRGTRVGAVASVVAVAIVSAASGIRLSADEPETKYPPAPQLTEIADWINSDGLTLADQQGKVVVLHFWAFGCINCQRNLPRYNAWQKDFAQDQVQIIGVHTPETADEADSEKLAAQIRKRRIAYPVAVDRSAATWKAYENRFWPTVYVIDRRGRIRYRWEGELEYRQAGGDRIVRAKIKELLAEDK